MSKASSCIKRISSLSNSSYRDTDLSLFNGFLNRFTVSNDDNKRLHYLSKQLVITMADQRTM